MEPSILGKLGTLGIMTTKYKQRLVFITSLRAIQLEQGTVEAR